VYDRIYQILVEFLGESKQGSYDKNRTQYQFCCPCCKEENGGVPDGKFNLEVQLSKNGFVYKCWRCCETDGTHGKLSKLIKKYGSARLYGEYKQELENLVKSKLYDINAYSGQTAESVDITVQLPETYKMINLKELKDYRIIEYLKKRKIDQNIINRFKIGYTTWDEPDRYMRNRIVVPSYDEFGDLNYWSARDFTGKAKSKYKNCSNEKNDIIFQEYLIDWDSDIILCEGTFDSIYLPNCISLLGKSLTNKCKLYHSLKERANGRVIICLDADTDISETKKIYNLLNNGRLKDKVFYIRLDYYKDFGEIYENLGKIGMINVISKIRQFDDIDLII
jgi:hypothetical protein